MSVHGPLHRRYEAVRFTQDQRPSELVARAERLVEGLTADARGGGDVGHRDLVPAPAGKLVAGGIEKGAAQQLPGGHCVGGALGGKRQHSLRRGCLGLMSCAHEGHRRLALLRTRRLEIDLVADTAVRAWPIVRDLVPRGPRREPLAGMALLLVIEVAAAGTAPA